ncbi:tRNA cyclic N6-threonylcarbamoyladenosine(37) synthase TcdA [Saccharospirillum mangrovi]|uniref:tRNA cyclic N6-threonylcarbamoyladenosine(37) synthase TcdA n=1 Tax=Saccharospirillum mangrovi TaxID=2161747 RepID=UPI000D3B47E3|nr:tRNA cyclic N6-threonylcarbamoyladenosine(37) synthase TcdA [Saccharospirillum mangrovi]
MASERFGGTERLYGRDQTAALQRSHVVVIGLGGVGSWAAEALARTAVGQLTLIDLDDLCVSNTNRQLHALEGNVGRMKVDVMAERLRAINPDIQVNAITDFLTPDNLTTYLDPAPDAVLDAIDSVRVKAALIHYCKRQRIPLVTTGGAGGQIDPLKIQVDDLSRTTQDPLAARTRNLLRREYGFSRNAKRKFGVECVYSTEQLRYPQADGDVCAAKPAPGDSVRLDCATGFGASMMVTASFGMVAASRMVDRLLRVAAQAEPTAGDQTEQKVNPVSTAG